MTVSSVFFFALFPFQHFPLYVHYEHTLHVSPSLSQRTWHAHTLLHFLFQERINLFIYPFPLRPDIRKNLGFYNSSNGKRIKCEGERQKHPRYIIVSRVFRFLSPTKLNRYEQAVYSAAHTIQPLCLVGVLSPSKIIIDIDFNAVADCFQLHHS